MTRGSITENFKSKCSQLGIKGTSLIVSQNGFVIEMVIRMNSISNPIKTDPEQVSNILRRAKGKIFGSFEVQSSVRSDQSMIFLSVNNESQDRIDEFLDVFCQEIHDNFKDSLGGARAA